MGNPQSASGLTHQYWGFDVSPPTSISPDINYNLIEDPYGRIRGGAKRQKYLGAGTLA